MNCPFKISKEVTAMNDIIRSIEAGQLKNEVTEFRVGDTVKVYANPNPTV